MADIETQARQSLDKLVPNEMRQKVEVEPVIRQGVPFLEIVRVAAERKADLIVMGTHGRTGLAHALMGSVAEKVVRMAACPVLTVRHAAMQVAAA